MSTSTPSPTSLPTPNVPQVDSYGVDLVITADGDLQINASGQLMTVAGPYNCAQAIFLRYKTAPGELPLHPDYGSSVSQMIGGKMSPAGIIAQANADLNTLVAEDPRFSAAQIKSAITPASENYPQDSIAIGVQATLSGGESLTLANVSDPTPANVSTDQPVDPSVDPTLTYDPLSQQAFFADSASEYDQLNDLNTLQAIVNDVPGSAILGTSGA